MAHYGTAEIERSGVQPSWNSRIICPDLGLRPRQFEYCPNIPGRLVFGYLYFNFLNLTFYHFNKSILELFGGRLSFVTTTRIGLVSFVCVCVCVCVCF